MVGASAAPDLTPNAAPGLHSVQPTLSSASSAPTPCCSPKHLQLSHSSQQNPTPALYPHAHLPRTCFPVSHLWRSHHAPCVLAVQWRGLATPFACLPLRRGPLEYSPRRSRTVHAPLCKRSPLLTAGPTLATLPYVCCPATVPCTCPPAVLLVT